MKYNVILIDDEPIALDVVSNHLQQFDNLDIAGKFTNAVDAIPLLHKQAVDLIFLDIEMPGISGINFLKSLQNPPYIIFTTAYRNYAVEAFDLEVIDYLLKPISFDRFLRALNRFFAQIEQKRQPITDVSLNYIIKFKADKKIYKINANDILYIEGMDDYIKVNTTEQKIVVYQRMHNIEKELDSSIFVRIHRSFIVNIQNVSAYSTSHVEIGKNKLPIGRTYRHKALQMLKVN